MEGQEEMLKDISGVKLCNLLSTLISIRDFTDACNNTTGHTSRVHKKSPSCAGKNMDNIH